MPPPPEGPRAKLARAREHLDTLGHEIEVFLSDKPYRAAREIDPQNGDHIWRMEVHRAAPVRLGVLIGDIVHNLRSGLDNLAWQLALIRTSTPHGRTEFPIYRDPGPGGNCFDPDGRDKIRDLPDVAQELIETMQPYKTWGPIGRALWMVHEISRTDKHRIVLIPSARLAGMTYPASYGGVLRYGACNHGDELFRVSKTRSPNLHEIEKVGFYFGIGIDVPGIPRGDTLGDLNHAYKVIHDRVIPAFERWCFGPDSALAAAHYKRHPRKLPRAPRKPPRPSRKQWRSRKPPST